MSFRYLHRTCQFTPKMKANAEPRLLSSLVWIDSGVVVSQHCLESSCPVLWCFSLFYSHSEDRFHRWMFSRFMPLTLHRWWILPRKPDNRNKQDIDVLQLRRWEVRKQYSNNKKGWSLIADWIKVYTTSVKFSFNLGLWRGYQTINNLQLFVPAYC